MALLFVSGFSEVVGQDADGFALGSDAVVRLDRLSFDVRARDKATTTVRRVVSVLNANGREAGVLAVNYDDELRRLRKFNGIIRDASGDIVRRLSNKEEEDYSAISGFSLYDANRVRVGRLYHDSYPYTVEFEYEIEHRGLISWPSWYPLEHDLPVEAGEFEIRVPKGMPVRYRTTGSGIALDSLSDGRGTTYRWHTSRLPVSDPEPYGPRWVNLTAAVHTAPTEFAIDGAAGNMATWSGFGAWYAGLGEGKGNLPAGARKDVMALTKDVSNPIEKARLIYSYLQENTRYVSIQLGLGGWQPFDASYVYTNGYGDCKALTNYLYALLRVAGIESYPVLIRGGRNAADVLPDFPSNQFNHVVLAIPQAADTLWLESTSQTLPFGHLGTFTEDRFGLLVKPGGGELVRTPRSHPANNVREVSGTIMLDPTGTGSAELQALYTGNQLDDVRDLVLSSPQGERERWVSSILEAPNHDVTRVDLSEIKRGASRAEVSLSVDLPRYATKAGSRLLLPVGLLDRWRWVPPPVETRTHPITYFGYAFVDVVSIRFDLPDGYDIASIPDPVVLSTDFGEFSAEVIPLEGNALEYRRRLRITELTMQADQYAAFRAFARQAAEADKWVVLLQSR